MKSRTNSVSRAQGWRSVQGDGPNWILIAGGALLSTVSIRLGFKLKEALDRNEQRKTRNDLDFTCTLVFLCNVLLNMICMICITRGLGPTFSHQKFQNEHVLRVLHPNSLGDQGTTEIKQLPNSQIVRESDIALPLVTVPPPEFNKENGVMWSSSSDCLELPCKPFYNSNCFDSPCVSESGSDIFSKQEVIQKLRQQLRRRDDMIMEMQDQIVELQSSLKSQSSHSSHLQSLLDAVNMDLLESERETQRLRKAIADHCVGQIGYNGKQLRAPLWPPEGKNGHSNGYVDVESSLESLEKGRGDGERIEMLKRTMVDLKEVLEGKEFLLQNYKEQKTELSVKVKELQQKLDSQLPNIL